MDIAEKHTFHHFSHQHLLESTILSSTGNITCYGCSLTILSGKDYYDCKTCSFSLHRICSNMPRKTRHPAHPNHYLTLLVSPPSANSTFKCKACGNNVSGFYYNCAECGIYYHILCSSLPLSVAITSHPHTLKIEVSSPYDFCCDLCDKPTHLGWLYRCRFCEFDAHISCAISDQRVQPVPPPNTLTRKIIYSSASTMEVNRMIDYGIESKELMQLVLQGVSRIHQDSNDQEVAHSTAVSGWDERLRSPKENHDRDSGGFGRFRLNQTETQISSTLTSPISRSQNKDASTPASEDLTIPSYQFSDLCFSIDLQKSYSSQDHKFQANREASYREMEKVIVPEVEARTNFDDAKMLNKTSDNSQPLQQELDYPRRPMFNPLYKAPENWLNEELSSKGVNHYDAKLGQYQANGKTIRSEGREIANNSTKSKKSSSRCSCWTKLFRCCYYSRYQRCSRSFKNGGL
ncbi:uncharacterized protein LOC8267079 [Ricinus communis]|uniref:uncharacterized protein LOC8267079 n=1 Tax=Ricinus communis TaxID=3988 RepID=UPI0007728728|nr:uncharacterized protein LOC8267079 [Ricinus communis]|eukprot:XP_015581806.1 uncharacterized protein LOC8267079 [Ricinus communis]